MTKVTKRYKLESEFGNSNGLTIEELKTYYIGGEFKVDSKDIARAKGLKPYHRVEACAWGPTSYVSCGITRVI